MENKELYGFLEIIEIPIETAPGKIIKIVYNNEIIHDSVKRRTNLFFLFHSLFYLGLGHSFSSICSYFENLTRDILLSLESIGSKLLYSTLTPLNEYTIFACLDIVSTIQDFLIPCHNNISNDDENGIVNNEAGISKSVYLRIKEIHKKYSYQIMEIENKYSNKINRIKYHEELEVSKALNINKSINKKQSLRDFMKIKDLYSFIEEKSVSEFMLNKITSIYNNINNIYNLRNKYSIINNIIINNKAILSNIHVATIIVEFPLFWNDYTKLLKAGIINERENNLHWNRSNVSLIDYFSYIFHKNMTENNKHSIKKNNKNNDGDRIPWIVLERAFDKKDLKNSKSSSNGKSKDFYEIMSILRL
jgi:hypothetical protein